MGANRKVHRPKLRLRIAKTSLVTEPGASLALTAGTMRVAAVTDHGHVRRVAAAARYRGGHRSWSKRPSTVLVDTALAPGGRRTTTGRLRPDRKARVHTRKPATEIIGLGDGGFKRPAACQSR